MKESLLHDFHYNGMILIWASMKDKDIHSSLNTIAPLAQKIIFTSPEAERSADPEYLARLLPENMRNRASCAASVPDALRMAMEVFQPGNLICIAGSLYLVGKARQILCGELVPGP